ncbi:glyoxalase-like protein [Paraburkholderia unamae]|uniref:VOC family protein n=1 Tax=Paraburkholderia unamae TaxID=219649 RepID=UPI000DC47C72|nr:VOC family protein [Paraburkholderia unamae]RAR54555.1 glyoxalase-like protein [Paraburkholderia unamae]
MTTMLLDHIAWGAPDLDAACASFETLTGIAPVTGGSHAGFGTRNRLSGLSPSSFFEIVAPDPAQPESRGGLAAAIAALAQPTILSYMVQTLDLEAACAAAEQAGLSVIERRPMSRTRPDGVRLAWTIAKFSHAEFGAAIPFAIDWQGSPHPAATTPGGATLKQFAVQHPKARAVARIYDAIGIEIDVQGAVAAGFVAVLDTPRGEVCFTSQR